MNNKFTEKCNEVFETQNQIDFSNENFQNEFGFSVSNELKYLFSNYGGIFLKEGYELISYYHSKMADEYGIEPFLYFLSNDSKNNIYTIYKQYKEFLGDNLYPIALAEGQNLICIDNKEQVYLWIHDDNQGVEKIFDSITQMIELIGKVSVESKLSGVIEEESWLADDFWSGLDS